jgi:hypothetical protein
MAEELALILQGGVKISAPIPTRAKTGTQGGTLGCFAREKTGSKRYVLLTNQHVVNFNSIDLAGAKGRRICFEDYTDCDDRFVLRSCSRVIARVLNNEYNDFIDAAIVALKPSWKGGEAIKFRTELTDGVEFSSPLPIVGTMDLRGKPDSFFAQTPFNIVKFGSTTRKTAGRILTADYPNATFPRDSGESEGPPGARSPTGQIMVEADASFASFADHGDSGSVIVTPDGHVVGLLYGISTAHPKRAYAAHIGDVTERFNIEILTTSTAPDTTTVPANNLDGVPDNKGQLKGAEALGRVLAARGVLVESLPGRNLLSFVDRHEAELMRLAGEKARLKVAWGHYGGHEIAWELLTTICEPTHELPAVIEGHAVAASIAAISRQVKRYASPELRRDLDECEALAASLVGRRWEDIVATSDSRRGILQV